MEVSPMLQQPDSSWIAQRDNLDHSAESACVRKWSSRGFAYERAIIDFIRRWHRFGGGSARDIFEEFVLSEHEFFSKTIELLGSTGASGVSEETAIRIRKVCRWRLSVRSHTPAFSSDRLRGCRRVTPSQALSFVGAWGRWLASVEC